MRNIRLIALLSSAAAAAVVVVGLSAASGRSSFKDRAGAPGPPPSGIATPTSREPLLAFVQAANSSVSLARLDPLSLAPVSRQVGVGEYHGTWSLSPDGTQLALGVSSGVSVLSPSRRLRGRIGIYIVDLVAMALVREVETGIAAEALGWLAPRRLVAGLQRGGTVLVDPLTGRILRRWLSFSLPRASARSGNAP